MRQPVWAWLGFLGLVAVGGVGCEATNRVERLWHHPLEDAAQFRQSNQERYDKLLASNQAPVEPLEEHSLRLYLTPEHLRLDNSGLYWLVPEKEEREQLWEAVHSQGPGTQPRLSPAWLELDKGIIPEDKRRGYLIRPLFEDLQELVGDRKAAHQMALTLSPEGARPWSHALIWIDPRVPYQTVVQVLYTLGQAEISDIGLVVRSSQGEGAMPLLLPKIGGGPMSPDHAHELCAAPSVEVTSGALCLGALEAEEHPKRAMQIQVARKRADPKSSAGILGKVGQKDLAELLGAPQTTGLIFAEGTQEGGLAQEPEDEQDPPVPKGPPGPQDYQARIQPGQLKGYLERLKAQGSPCTSGVLWGWPEVSWGELAQVYGAMLEAGYGVMLTGEQARCEPGQEAQEVWPPLP